MQKDSIEQEFLQVLALRRERPGEYDSWFYDASIVYVYGAPYSDPLVGASNLLHEYGHARLADTPLGFLHQGLYELAAGLGTRLYLCEILPALQPHAQPGRYPVGGQGELLHGQPRERPEDRAQSQRVADDLFHAAHSSLTAALGRPEVRPLVQLFLRLQKRRRLLISAANYCHEVAAVHWQLGPRSEIVSDYLRVLGARDTADPGIKAFLEQRRVSLAGRPKEIYDFGLELQNMTGREEAPIVACRLAHHFAYPGLGVLDMAERSFGRLAKSTALSADLRLRWLAARPEALARACQDGEAEAAILRDMLAADLNRKAHARQPGFFAWSDRQVLGSLTCRKVGIQARRKTPRQATVDDWCTQAMPPSRRRPPFVGFDGTVVAANQEEEALLRQDVVRAQHMRIVERVLERLAQ